MATARWRATFAATAVTDNFGTYIPIDADQDSYEWHATMGNQKGLIGCVPASSDVGEVAFCDVQSVDRFDKGLGLIPIGNLYFEVVDGLIGRFKSHDFELASTIIAAWGDFVLWVADRNLDDALAIRTFGSNAEGAEIGLSSLDEYFEQ